MLLPVGDAPADGSFLSQKINGFKLDGISIPKDLTLRVIDNVMLTMMYEVNGLNNGGICEFNGMTGNVPTLDCIDTLFAEYSGLGNDANKLADYWGAPEIKVALADVFVPGAGDLPPALNPDIFNYDNVFLNRFGLTHEKVAY